MPGSALDAGSTTRIAGWYGKIPALGDFASRRLPVSFIHSWDAWLQRSIASSRSSLRERWQDIYLNSPIWRFALLPGILDDKCWIGIMMPSADRVGRYFPLTIATSIEPHPEVLSTVFRIQNWFAALEQIALASLSMDFTVMDLEDLLVKNPLKDQLTEGKASPPARKLASWWAGAADAQIALTLPDLDSMTTLLEASGTNLLYVLGTGKSLWWTCDEVAETTQFRCFTGLPPDDDFSDLLAGTVSRPMLL